MSGPEDFVLSSVIAVDGVIMLALCVLFARQFFHDLVRFGREGIPWAWMLVLAEAMSVTGYGLVGTRWGLVTGLVILPPFGLGRWRGRKEAK